MKKINLTINGVALKVDEGTSILNAAKSINVHIPTLCHRRYNSLFLSQNTVFLSFFSYSQISPFPSSPFLEGLSCDKAKPISSSNSTLNQ